MQDNSQNSSKHVGLSKGQSIKGPPNAKKTRDGESGPSPAGTPQQYYSHLQGPQRQYYKGNQGPQYPPKYVTQKSSGLSKGSNIQITLQQVPLTTPNPFLPTQTTHPSPPTHPPNHRPPPGLNPTPHHTIPQSFGSPLTDPCLPNLPPNHHPPTGLNPFPQTPGFAPFAHATYTQQPPYAPYPPPHTPQPLPHAPNPYPPHPYPPPNRSTQPPPKNQGHSKTKSLHPSKTSNRVCQISNY